MKKIFELKATFNYSVKDVYLFRDLTTLYFYINVHRFFRFIDLTLKTAGLHEHLNSAHLLNYQGLHNTFIQCYYFITKRTIPFKLSEHSNLLHFITITFLEYQILKNTKYELEYNSNLLS